MLKQLSGIWDGFSTTCFNRFYEDNNVLIVWIGRHFKRLEPGVFDNLKKCSCIDFIVTVFSALEDTVKGLVFFFLVFLKMTAHSNLECFRYGLILVVLPDVESIFRGTCYCYNITPFL